MSATLALQINLSILGILNFVFFLETDILLFSYGFICDIFFLLVFMTCAQVHELHKNQNKRKDEC